MGDLGDIVNAVSQVVKICDTNVAQAMGQHAHALPRGIDPMGGEVSGGTSQSAIVAVNLIWRADYPSIASDTNLTIGISWLPNLQVSGRGQFLKDAYAYCTVTSVTGTWQVDVTAKFDDTGTPIGDRTNPTALLRCLITINRKHMYIQEDTHNYEFSIMGNGQGSYQSL